MTDRLRDRATTILALAGWLLFGYLTVETLSSGAAGGRDVFQVDWHVYWAGARDLGERDLYRSALDADGLTLSTPHYNLPPISAVLALPISGLPIAMGGYAWQVVGAASVATATIVALDILQARRPWVLAGLALGPLALTLLYLEGLHLATNNYLVLAVVAGAVLLYLRGHDAGAGALLGVAIATKLWPAVILAVAMRERRWALAAWAIAVAAATSMASFAWLGLDAIPLFLDRLRTEIPPTGFLIGPTAVAGLRELWNGGLGLLVGIGILALPLRGRGAIGAAIVAGMAAIPNLWIHYGPTLLFALALLGDALWRRKHSDQLEQSGQPGDDQEQIPDH